jgi:NADPH2:quinone reductase
MKAIQIHEYGDVDVLQIEEVARPVPAPHQVLIKVAVVGVNVSDIGQRSGKHPLYLPPLPLVLGFEAGGYIEEVGAEVTSLQVGMRVVSEVRAGYAEYVVADAQNVVPVPEQVGLEQAVMIPVQGKTAYLILIRTAQLQEGESVLVHSAAGGVGSIAVQLAKLLGAGTVIGTTTSSQKEALIRSLGADVVVNTTESHWTEQVMQATGGRGVDIVLNCIGGEVARQSFECLALSGRFVSYGDLSGGSETILRTAPLVARSLKVMGFSFIAQSLEDQRHACHELLRLLSEQKLCVLLDSHFRFEDVRAAHAALEANKTYGKVILTL